MRFLFGALLGGTTLLVFWSVVIIGATMGAQVGLHATTADEAVMEYNGTHLIAGSNATDAQIDWDDVEENPEKYRSPRAQWFHDRFGDELERIESALPGSNREEPTGFARTLAETQMSIGMTLAATSGDMAASFVYSTRGWLPVWLIQSALQIGAYVPFIGYLAMVCMKLQEMVR